MKLRLLAPAWLLASGCIVDGAFLVRGTVTDPRTSTPIPGASVRIGRDRGNGEATSGADGRFEATYHYGGMFPFTFGRPNPPVEIAAAGFRTRTLELESAAVQATDATRARCAPEPDCTLLDVSLDPESVSAGP